MSTDEAIFMDPQFWGETRAGNPTCDVEMESDDGLYTMEYTVVIFPAKGKYGFVIYVRGTEGKIFSRNRYSSPERARYWAWTRLELLT